ncbi:MAG: thermonuclease family protein [archaeon]|nr:thermonuclease family protein [archaeon]
MNKRIGIFILVISIFILFAINYSWIDSYVIKEISKEESSVLRVVDGDTIKIENETVRLLGINTPEKGEKYYQEAKDFLEVLILNKTIQLESGKENRDKYYRKLRYIFVDGKNINLELVKNGFANPYFPAGKDKYSNEFYEAWNQCLKENIKFCERSANKCTTCIELKEFDYRNGIINLNNNCSYDCNLKNWIITNEGRKRIILNETINAEKEITITTEGIWTNTGDSLFLRDKEGKLILWRNY